MKKLLSLALAAMMLLTFAACGGETPAPETAAPVTEVPATEAPATEAPTEDAAEPDAAEETAVAPVISESLLVDNESCSFSVSAASETAHLGTTLDALCVNKTDRTLMFTWNTVSVCGYLYDPLWSQEVAPGETVTGTVYIDTFQLEQYGITSLDELQFTLYIFDTQDFMAEPIVNESFTVYPTGLDAASMVYPRRNAVAGEQIVIAESGLDFIIESFQDDGTFYTLRCYVGNGTDTALMYAWEDVTVNGAAIDPMWALEIPSGKQAYSDILFFRSDLAENEITDVEQISFRLNITDPETGDTVLDETFTFRAEDSLVG